MVLPLRSATEAMLPRTTMPSPPEDQSTCWKMRGALRESFMRSGAKSTIMSRVPHSTWLSPAAKASRATTGSSMSLRLTLKPYFLAKIESAFGANPPFAATMGSQPIQTLIGKLTTFCWLSHL